MEYNQRPVSSLLAVYSWKALKEEWNQVQQRWYTIYEHWYPLLTDEWPADVLAVEAEWFLAEVPLSIIRRLLKQRGIEWIWEFRGEEAPASFRLACDLFMPCYTGDEGYWTSEGYDWLIYASQESSLTFAGSWLVQAVKDLWPDWAQHIWRGPEYVRPLQTLSPRPRGAFPGDEQLKYDARLLCRAERARLWHEVKNRWQIPDTEGWYPLIGEPEQYLDIVCLQEEWFSFALSKEILAEILKERGIRWVWGIKEGQGIVWEVERELMEPWYDGLESYWTSADLDWLLYVSHESSVTIAGAWLIDAVKKAWPEWHRHQWYAPGYPSPPEQINLSSEQRLPRSFG